MPMAQRKLFRALKHCLFSTSLYLAHMQFRHVTSVLNVCMCVFVSTERAKHKALGTIWKGQMSMLAAVSTPFFHCHLLQEYSQLV